MTTKELYVLGVVPGGITGWAWLQVPRMSIFADDLPEILEWDYGELTGPLPQQATDLARMAREIQGLAYKTGPALIIEREAGIGPMLQLLQYQGNLGDSTLHFQDRDQATTPDDRLRKLGLYAQGPDSIRHATRHALAGLRRANEQREYALGLWPYPPNGVA